MGLLIRRFLAHIMPGVVRPLHALWNEIIGFIFFVLAMTAVPSLVRHIRSFDGDAESFFGVFLSFGYGAVMLYFAISSFLRARKISRS
jgi:hypothetical protein